MDRVIYEVARHLNLDPAEVIRRNLITADQMPHPRGMPYRDGQEIVYDCGDFPAAFEQLLDLVDYREHKQDQVRLRERDVWRGIGFGTYIEGTGIGPFESAVVQIDSQGKLVVAVGSASQGQSHTTTISQIVADEFGMRPEDVVFREGDTSLIPYGVGTFASRSAVTAGSAVATSSRRLKERIKTMAGDMLEASPSDLEVGDGYVFVRGSEDYRVSFRDIFVAASPGSAHYYSANPRFQAPAGMEPGTAETEYFVPPTVTFGYGLVAAVVEVDVETGFVDLQKVAIIHDCGRIINPLVVEGQIQGGVVQGIGAALYEDFVYDDQGQPLTTTFMDYMLPTSAEIPEIVQVHLETPSERNPLGIKGVGEAGIIAPPAAIANAVADALAPMRIQISDLPLSPNAIVDAIDHARASRNPRGAPNRREEATTTNT